MGTENSKKKKKDSKSKKQISSTDNIGQPRQIIHSEKPKIGKEVLEKSYLHEQINYIFGYATTLSEYTTKNIYPLDESLMSTSEKKKYYSSYTITKTTQKKIEITTKEIYQQNDTIKDILLLSDDLYVTITDYRVEIWNFANEESPKPVDLLIPMITKKISSHNYFYCLTKLSDRMFSFVLKTDQTIVVCYLDQDIKAHCFLLESKNEVVGMAPIDDWKMVTVSREAIINLWNIKIQKCEKVMKDKTKQLTISFMHKLSESLVLLSDWHSPLTLICDITKNTMVKTFPTDVREVIKLSKIQYLFIGKNMYIQYDIQLGEKLNTIQNINDDVVGKETKFYSSLTVDKYLFFCQANEKVYLKKVFSTEENTVKTLSFPPSLTKIRVIQSTDAEEEGVNPVVIFFFSRKYIILDSNLLISGQYQEQNLYFNYMFSYADKIYYLTKEERKINDNKGISLLSYPDGKVLNKMEFEDSRFYKLKITDLMAICGIDLRIISCVTYDEIAIFENVIPKMDQKEEQVNYLYELKESKVIVYAKTLFKIIDLSSFVGDEDNDKKENNDDEPILSESDKSTTSKESELFKVGTEIKQIYQFSDTKIAIFRDNIISIFNLESFEFEKEVEIDKTFCKNEQLDITLVGNEIIGFFNKDIFEMWELNTPAKYTKFEEIEKKLKREEINVLRANQEADGNNNYFAVTNYNIRNNKVNISVLVKDVLQDKWGYINNHTIYAFAEKNFYIFDFEK